MSLNGVDVLLVDDDEDTLALFRESLQASGATVRAVASADEAVRANRERPAGLWSTTALGYVSFSVPNPNPLPDESLSPSLEYQ